MNRKKQHMHQAGWAEKKRPVEQYEAVERKRSLQTGLDFVFPDTGSSFCDLRSF